MALEDHLLVQLAHAHRFALAVRQKNAVQSAVGNGACIQNRQPRRTIARRHHIADAIPRQPRPQLGKLVRWVAPAQQIQHAFKRRAAQPPKRRSVPHQLEQRIHAHFRLRGLRFLPHRIPLVKLQLCRSSRVPHPFGRLRAGSRGPPRRIFVARVGFHESQLSRSIRASPRAFHHLRLARRRSSPGRMRHNRHQLLRQHVQRIARKPRGLDVPLVHGARHGCASHQVGAILGKQNPLAHRVHMVPCAANALHSTRHRWRRFDLDHQIHRAHIDAQFQRGSGAQGANLSRLQLLLDDRPLRRRQRAVMRARNRLAGQLIQRPRQPLGHLPAVHKQNRRVARANNLQQSRMNRIPDRNPLGRL